MSLKLAIRGRIPLIKVVTTDLVNIKLILDAHAPDDHEFVEADVSSATGLGYNNSDFMYCISPPEDTDWESLYHKICDDHTEQCVVVVNPTPDSPTFFDGGLLHLPKSALVAFLSDIADKGQVSKLALCLGGLTLKEVGEVCKMAMAVYGKLTPTSVNSIRRAIMPNLPGLEHVNTAYKHYRPDPELAEWMDRDGRLFRMTNNIPKEIVPRGVLFLGDPGTGKTMAARYMASQWGVPLYRLDVAAALNKYIGESEGNVRSILQKLDDLEPCVVLIDEIEKLFQGDSDTGVSLRILSTLLWWLQEHTSRVFTVITSNNVDGVPKELLRHIRVDKHFALTGLKAVSQKKAFVLNELKSLKAPEGLYKRMPVIFDKGVESQAALAYKARRILRDWKLDH